MSLEDIERAIVNLSEQTDRLSLRQEFIFKPFGKGILTTDGVQYSTEITTSTDVYEVVETITLKQPNLTIWELYELEFGLTMRIKSSGAAESVLWKFQGSDNNTGWEDLIAEQTRAASAAAYADISALGRWAPTGLLKGLQKNIYVRGVVKSGAAAGETASAGMKSSSYVIAKYMKKI